MDEIIQQGAEAVLIKKEVSAVQLPADSRFAPSARNSKSSLRSRAPRYILLKRRVAKGYRLKELDVRIRKLRTRSEARLLEKAGKLICVPKVRKFLDFEIEMEFVDGLKLSESLDEMKNWGEVCFEIGKNIALLHDAGIIHGDLTTSNMIWVSGGDKIEEGARELLSDSRFAPSARNSKSSLRSPARTAMSGKLYFIDFGLGFANGRTEDKAVDLHLIKQALEAKHFLHFEKFFGAMIEGYRGESKNANEVLRRLEKVEKRGRYKAQY